MLDIFLFYIIYLPSCTEKVTGSPIVHLAHAERPQAVGNATVGQLQPKQNTKHFNKGYQKISVTFITHI